MQTRGERKRDRQIDRDTERVTERNRQTDRLTDRDRQTDGHTDILTENKITDRQKTTKRQNREKMTGR